ncbi:MAG TPA: response regulator transcription factor [Actinomycetales bacterium]|nr:response regulator transcription factor [Actinomycetales bacterium]
MTVRTRVVVVDDHDLVRAGLVAILGTDPELEVVGEAGDGMAAARAARDAQAHVVLMDLSMPRADGIAGLRAIRSQSPSTAVVMLTTFNMDESIERALREGAAGYLLKTAPAQELVAAVKAAHRGERVFSSGVQDRLVDAFLDKARTPPAPPRSLRELTDREVDVFRELARGQSNAEIAERLHLSEATVKKYVTRILAKLGLRDRVQAVVFAFQHGLTEEQV